MTRWIVPMLLAAAMAVGWPLLLPWSYHTRDGAGAAVEAAQAGAALHDGQIPVRWLPDLASGRGLPVFLYASPLAFYAIALLHLTGLGVIVATKIVVLAALALAALAMLAWLKTHVPLPAAAVGAAAYGAAPVAAAIVHVLGDPALAVAYALVPLVLLGARRGIPWLGLAFAALIVADATTACAVLPLLAVYAVVLRAPGRIAAGVALGALVAIFQWGPAWAERDLVDAVRAPSPFGAWALVKLASVPVALLATGLAGGRGRERALAALGVAGLALAFAVDPVRPLVLVAVIAAVAAATAPLRLLLLALSSVPAAVTAAFAIAHRNPLLGLLAAGQVVAGAAAIAAATLDERIAERGPPAIAGLLVALALPFSAVPVRSMLTGDPPVATLHERDLTPEQVRFVAGRPRPADAGLPRTVAAGTPAPIPGPRADVEVRGGQLDTSIVARTASRWTLDATSPEGAIVALELHDFPGWELTLAAPPGWRPEEVAHGADRAGRIAVSIPPGTWRVEASWTETPLRRRCDEASAAGLGVLVVLLALPGVTIRRRRI
ncbi:MAG TPA: hypothetical protein VFV19_01190 [Candidatus Polarisedimenticolaceae bacterium]|nr:hypothetical protein [Candidatus Polarisedimenticolaceae bacterium]